MIVIVDKSKYVVPASVGPALRRTFGTAKALARGMTMEDARSFVAMRIVWRRSIVTTETGFAVSYATGRRVANVLAERLVRRWLRDGTLEVVSRGRYRRAALEAAPRREAAP